MMLVEYFAVPNVSYGEEVRKMYVDISQIQYITYTFYGCSKNVVISINGVSFMLTTNSGNDLLAQMGLSKEDLFE